MASKTQEEILRRFEQASPGKGVTGSGGESIKPNSGEIDQVTGATARSTTPSATAGAVSMADLMTGGQAAWTPAGQNVQGGSKTEQQSSSGSSAEDIVKDVFESGIGVVPLLSSLFGLFGGGDEQSPPLLKYQMPSSVSFMSADTDTGLTAADYDQMGSPRVYDSSHAQAAGSPGSSSGGSLVNAGISNDTRAAGATPAAPQITVNVQAMDAQSFADRSSDIAQAVRSAMLNLSSINDVVNEL